MRGQLPWLQVHQTDQGTVETESVLAAPDLARKPRLQRGSSFPQSVLFSELSPTYRDCSFTRPSASSFVLVREFPD